MTPSPALPLSIPEIHQAIRDAGGIVHSDGNIFFTRAEQFVVAGVLCDERSAAPSPALPREGQPGLPGQVRDHLTSHAGEVLTVSEARVAPEKLLRQALDVLNETIPDWRTPMEKQRRMAACRVAIDGFLAAPRRETQPLTEQRIDALAKQHLKAFAQFVGAGEVTYEGEQEFARAIEAELGVMPAAPRRDAADTEPHGPNELNSESAPGESADPQSQGDTQ